MVIGAFLRVKRSFTHKFLLMIVLSILVHSGV
jgi:hypothetical protein